MTEYIPSNYSTISFPWLGIEINPSRELEIIENVFSVRYYGLIIALGLLLAVIYGCRRCKQFGLKEDDILDGVLCVTPFAIICARIYYCIFAWNEEFASQPIKALYIWEGGIAIYGGVLGAIIGVLVFCKVKKIKCAAVLDLVALGFLIGQGIGRWGNFFNREAFGAATDSFFRMGLYNVKTGAFEYYHPTFLYESLWNLAGFVLLHFCSKKRTYDGQIALGYALWYGLGRTFIEGLRVDSLYLGPFRVSQLLAAVSCTAAAIVMVIFYLKPRNPEKLFVNQVAAAAIEAANETEEELCEESDEEPEELMIEQEENDEDKTEEV